MKKTTRFVCALGFILISTTLPALSQVAISTDDSSADPSSMLEVKSTNKGVLIPRMTHAQLSSIQNPATGLMVYCTDCGTGGEGALAIFNGVKWNTFDASCLVPASPLSGTHLSSGPEITWNWNTVQYATGYKWGTTNVYTSAEDLGAQTTKTETGLTCNTAYTRYIWAYNSCGGSSSMSISKTTNPSATPSLTTASVTNIIITSATCGGNVAADVCPSVTQRGVCWSTSANPTISDSHTSDGIGTGTFVSNLTGLTGGTIYHVRAYATNSMGTSYGDGLTFTTLTLPVVTTTTVTNITQTTASGGGNVTADGGASITARGVCWSTSPAPIATGNHTTDGSGTGIFVSSLSGLTANTLYYVRAYATSSVGTAYGNETSFTTYKSDAIADIDGNYYNIVTIGTQTWMTENLKTTRYSNNELIGTTTPATLDITSETSPKYQWAYDGNEANVASYGRMYTGYAAADSRNLCPSGWRVPTDADWTFLINYLTNNGYGYQGSGSDISKAMAATSGWTTSSTPGTTGNDQGSNNSSGFTARPGGYRAYNGLFSSSGSNGHFWSSTDGGSNSAWYYLMTHSGSTLQRLNLIKSYGLSVRCLKDAQPTVTTAGTSNILQTTATSGGNVTSDGGVTVTTRGVCWSTSSNPTTADSHTSDGSGTGTFASSLTGLTSSTTYYVRAFATNSEGTAYGDEVSFNTPSAVLPTITTASITGITKTSATAGGNVTSDGGASITAKGVCWSTSPAPIATGSHTTEGSGTGIFTSNITNLTEGALYYVRAYATNSVGTAYGNETSFTTYKSDAISDIDGNYYNIVTIGTQTWMADNLKTTMYKDDTAIPLVTDGAAWGALTTPGYCWYNNDEATYKATYGAWYNWYTVSSGKLCPQGWHVPTDDEWTILTTSLGGQSVAGGKLKETGTAHWISPNTGATNETGFTGLPGGLRAYFGTFSNIGIYGYWWSSSEGSSSLGWSRALLYNGGMMNRDVNNYDKRDGFSVRCLKDGQPTVTTAGTSNILQTTATSGGNVTSDGGVTVTARGVCWSTSSNPTTADSHTSDGSGTGTFASSLTGLISSTTYYVRAYATNSIGTAYGNEVTFTTNSTPSQIIADHTVVDKFTHIPLYYMNEVKKMLFVIGGESHSYAYPNGLNLLESSYPAYVANESFPPEAYTTNYLRVTKGLWGDFNNATGWVDNYGEEDWFTSPLAISRTKAGITYSNTNSRIISAIGFGWCYDPDIINMTAYLSATQEYIDYCTSNSYTTKVFFTTGPVDGSNASGELGYNKFIGYESIRTYVKANSSRILFDYADILCYDDGSEIPNTATWNGHTYPIITATNFGTGSWFHINEAGGIRLAKAMWWMLARISGWDGIY